jgi:hypothetical protein
MEKENQFGCAIIIVNIIAILLTGIITWDNYTPTDFLQMICFLIIWAISQYFARKALIFGFMIFMNAIKK